MQYLGKAHWENKKSDSALFYYKKALPLSKEIRDSRLTTDIYQELSSVYEATNNQEKFSFYNKKYIQLSDSLRFAEKKSVDKTSILLNKEDKQQVKQFKNTFYFILAGIILLIVLSIFFAIKFSKKFKNIKQENDLKELEISHLEIRINDAFEEVVQLAKQNDPSFLARFQEVYPDVYQKLVSINSKLVNTELVLCAMIWLNFSSKDIAQYTFVQPKTVQVKKYRLRKKLNIPDDEDIYLFLKNL